MNLVSIPYRVELTDEEARTLYEAEALLKAIVNELPNEDLGALSAFRKNVVKAFDSLYQANCDMSVHMTCDPNY